MQRFWLITTIASVIGGAIIVATALLFGPASSPGPTQPTISTPTAPAEMPRRPKFNVN